MQRVDLSQTEQFVMLQQQMVTAKSLDDLYTLIVDLFLQTLGGDISCIALPHS